MINKNLTLAQIKRISPFSVEKRSLTDRVTYLVFNKVVGDFDIEDLRLLIGQGESLEL